MGMIWTLTTGSVPQWGAFGSLLIILGLTLRVWVKGIPERLRVKNEATSLHAKIEEDLRGEAAKRFKEFREEVHGLRNDVMSLSGRLTKSESTSKRRADKLSMMALILRLVMGELRRIDPDSEVLKQAEILMAQVLNETPEDEKSTTLKTAEHAVEAAQDTVIEVKASEAKA
jgi:hypothetical protein